MNCNLYIEKYTHTSLELREISQKKPMFQDPVQAIEPIAS